MTRVIMTLTSRRHKAERHIMHEFALNLAASTDDDDMWTRVEDSDVKAHALNLRRAARIIQSGYRSHLEKVEAAAQEAAASRAGTQRTTYWRGHGTFQDEYDALWRFVPPMGDTRVPHMQIFLAMNRIYHDFYTNGNDTFRAVWENGRYNPSYVAPADAPGHVCDFFQWGRTRIYDEDDDSDFDEELLEEMMDQTIQYVATHINLKRVVE